MYRRFTILPSVVLTKGGPVWFLTDVSGSGKEIRSCSIPAGKAVLFPILSGECDYGVSTVKTDSDMRLSA